LTCCFGRTNVLTTVDDGDVNAGRLSQKSRNRPSLLSIVRFNPLIAFTRCRSFVVNNDDVSGLSMIGFVGNDRIRRVNNGRLMISCRFSIVFSSKAAKFYGFMFNCHIWASYFLQFDIEQVTMPSFCLRRFLAINRYRSTIFDVMHRQLLSVAEFPSFYPGK
jgi:hypothetical protein